ncbi:MAG: hypothetical protein LBD59_10165 [Prevotellaceae bacterium]|jgi:hypothetical protein|nr:hypothetical protein [Prevotellaceae bacterium]
MNKFVKIIRTVLAGDALEYVIKYRKFMMFLFILAIIYISNGLMYNLEIKKYKDLETQLMRSKAQHSVRLEEMARLGKYSNLLELLKKHNRQDLKISREPPVNIGKP